MLTREKLVNIMLFMERVPCTGKEALAWSQTYDAVQAEIKDMDTPRAPDGPPPVDNKHVAPGCEQFEDRIAEWRLKASEEAA